jgi:hypothetical protein
MYNYNWDEILESPELCKLIYEDLGISKREWNKLVKNQDLDEAIESFYKVVGDGEECFAAVCESSGYGSTYRVNKLCGMYFTDNEGDGEGPMSIECLFDIAFFFTAKTNKYTKFEIKSSFDDKTIFKIIGDCDCPVTINGVKYIHDGKQYIKLK